MSLIAVAQQVRGPRTLTRTLLLLVAVTAAIIVGLLAMHSLNTHATTTGHAGTAPATSVTTDTAGHHDVPAAVNPAGAAADTSGCADCGDDHAMAWMACVLALLVSVILLARVRIGWRTPARDDELRVVRARWPASAHTVLPPSLTVLCISRT
ncbi:DUF6153 family protein [Microbacterium sp. 22296]|uniref:DUF6153 family protein n=1 Tax=Microbacterium sp. 22296 TaxID=3453903 RepID=UPI003F867960